MKIEDYMEKLIREEGHLGAMCLVTHPSSPGRVGIAFRVGEALSDKWRPGDVIVFWRDGTHTAPDGCEVAGWGDIWALLDQSL